MIARAMARIDRIARERQRQRIAELAGRLSEVLRGATIATEDARIIVSGKGVLRRWLGNPELRFLGGGLQ